MAQSGQATMDWAKYENEIRDLFVVQEKTLNEVVAHMKKEHNFEASARQYKSRFPKLKNVKAEEWIWIGQEIQYRAALGKTSESCLHDKPLPIDRVVRETARHKNKAPTATLLHRLPNPSPGRISVRTPPPMAAIASPPKLSPVSNLINNHVEYHAPQTYFEASLTEHLPLEVAFVEEPVYAFDAAMEMEAEIDADILINHMDSSSEWSFGSTSDFNYDFNFNFPPVNNLSPTTITKQAFSFSTVDSPRPRSAGHRLSLFPQLFNLEVLDPRPNVQIITNLPYFRLQFMLAQPEYALLQIHPILDGVLSSATNTSVILPTEARRDVLLKIVGIKPEVQRTENIAQVTSKLQRHIPEQYEGELFDKVGQILDPRSTDVSNLSSLFSLAAYFASNKALGADIRMDTFLTWVIDHQYTDYLERFLQINAWTIHAFAEQILKSAVRIRNIKLLTALLDHGVKFDSVLGDIFSIGDMELTKLVLSRLESTWFKGTAGIELFHRSVKDNHFDLARMLVHKGLSVDCESNSRTALYNEVYRQNIRTIRFLLGRGANVNTELYGPRPNTALGMAAFLKNADIVALLVEHGAKISGTVDNRDLLEWSSLNCRSIYNFLGEKFRCLTNVVNIGDLVDAAKRSRHSLEAYISKYEGQISTHQLEDALGESIRLGHMAATVALLQHGVSPDCYTLKNRPLWLAVHSKIPHRFCELLIKFKANVNTPGILVAAAGRADVALLQLLVKAGVNLEEQGGEALVQSIYFGNAMAVAFLLDSGVDVNTPGLEMNPLQAAASEGVVEMVEFLLTRGADMNAPAYPHDGRTALQSALESENPVEVAGFLLDKGVNISAPPALVGGVTALEAILNSWSSGAGKERIQLCSQLLDAGAPVNRPNGDPSSALHGAIAEDLEDIFSRMLEPQRNAVIDYMWCNKEAEEEHGYIWEPRTPTQLAAGYGRLKFVKMLLDRGADINEAPGYRFGRTALQAATSAGSPDMELVKFLLDKGANVNAKPAIYGGITALQGAAISGDIMLARLLLDKGAEVNAVPSLNDGRYAIEGAAEHGRLDMVQLLLNAGARGNVLRGTGFRYAINLAKQNHHFAVANLLETRQN